MTVYGIDVASYQPASYATAGLGFVWIKATEGTSYINPHHADQVVTGRKAHLGIGHYHFVRPGSMSAQADFFMHVSAPQPGDMLCLDWEDSGVSNADKDTFLKYVQAKQPAHRSVLYCNRDFWFHHDSTSFAGDGLWIADPGAPAGHPRVQHPWIFHQYSEAGGLDRNVGNFEDEAHLLAWARKQPPPPPAPHYQPFPGGGWFTMGRRSPIVAAMHDRLVAVGCGRYRTTSNKDLIGSGDVASYQAWQRKLGFSGAAATWPPGPTSWNKLQVPKVV